MAVDMAGVKGQADGLRMSSMSLESPSLCGYLEVSVACEKLRNKDLTSLSDPFAILYETFPNGAMIERGRTEVVFNDLNPKFCHKFVFEEKEMNKVFQLTFMDYDLLKNDDFLGILKFVPMELCTPKAHVTFQLEGKNGKQHRKNGYAHLYGERLLRSVQQYEVGMELGFSSDCKVSTRRKMYFCLSRSSADGEDYVRIFRSKPIQVPKDQAGFVLPSFEVDSSTLTAQDPKRCILLELFLEGGLWTDDRSVGEVVFKVEKLDALHLGESIAFFSGISADERTRPQLIFPCTNWSVQSNKSGVIVMRISNLLVRW